MDTTPSELTRQALSQDGYAFLRELVADTDLKQLNSIFAENASSARLSVCPPAVKTLLDAEPLKKTITAICGSSFGVVRIIYFNKSIDRRWFVPWHQDRTIAVRNKVDLKAYRNWTRKKNTWHVEPPVALLERMLTIRIHLDQISEHDGPLEVQTRSHLEGRLTQTEIKDRIATREPVQCLATRGDVLLMNPLLVHRSRRGSGHQRRIIHLELSPDQLPPPLEWQIRDQVIH